MKHVQTFCRLSFYYITEITSNLILELCDKVNCTEGKASVYSRCVTSGNGGLQVPWWEQPHTDGVHISKRFRSSVSRGLCSALGHLTRGLSSGGVQLRLPSVHVVSTSESTGTQPGRHPSFSAHSLTSSCSRTASVRP